jgi:hypothetical protein
MFRPSLEFVFEKERKSNAGAKGFDKVMMFECLILRSLYNLFDEVLKFQILDRLSFTRFLGISIGSKVPDATTILRFREELVAANDRDNTRQSKNQLAQPGLEPGSIRNSCNVGCITYLKTRKMLS